MPLIPRGIGDAFFDRIKDRVRRELGVDPNAAPASPTSPDPGLRSRIKQLVLDQLGLPPPGAPPPGTPPPPPPPPQPPQPPQYSGPPRSLAEVKERIQRAGRSRPPLLIRANYNGNYRDIEVYSYRFRDKDNPAIPLLYVYCHKDQQIESWKLLKIQDLQITERPYPAVRWDIEF